MWLYIGKRLIATVPILLGLSVIVFAITQLLPGDVARVILGREAKIKRAGIILLLVLIVQFSLGVANILLRLPVPVAVSHNGVAALLLISTLGLLFHARHSTG